MAFPLSFWFDGPVKYCFMTAAMTSEARLGVVDLEAGSNMQGCITLRAEVVGFFSGFLTIFSWVWAADLASSCQVLLAFIRWIHLREVPTSEPERVGFTQESSTSFRYAVSLMVDLQNPLHQFVSELWMVQLSFRIILLEQNICIRYDQIQQMAKLFFVPNLATFSLSRVRSQHLVSENNSPHVFVVRHHKGFCLFPRKIFIAVISLPWNIERMLTSRLSIHFTAIKSFE